MEITRQPAGEILVLKLQGRLDGAWSEHTGVAITRAIEEGWHQLALDLSGVGFVSSAGIRVLVIHYKQLNKIQGRLMVVKPSPEARQVLEMSGLGMMVSEAEIEIAPVAKSSAEPPANAPRTLERNGLRCEIFSVEPNASLCVRMLGADAPHRPRPGEPVRFPEGVLGLGLGAFDQTGRLGEFVALGGAAIAQPADGQQTTDYLVEQGEMLPEVRILSGLVAEGGFAQLIRFDARETEEGSVPLSGLLELALELCGNRAAGIALAAETATLVGAALSRQPDSERGILFDFPEVRESLVFTGEPAWPHSLSLAVGFLDAAAESPLGALLRPVSAGLPPGQPGLRAHVHAAAFPYRPLPKGFVELGPTVRQLLEEERVLGLLHLLNDWRQPGGVGESRFHRGAIWIAPLQLPEKA